MNKPMTSHELAHKLLALPEHEVIDDGQDGDFNPRVAEVRVAKTEENKGENLVRTVILI
jgi:hypothetical protein